MARRSVLPAYVRDELPQRAKYGLGHDMLAPTSNGGSTITAFNARLADPSPEMMETVRAVWAVIEAEGGTSVGLLLDTRHAKHPGCITITWGKGPKAIDVAARFATSYLDDGTPKIPGWLSLKSEDDWDLRWQPTYGPIFDPQETETPAFESTNKHKELLAMFSDS